MRAPVASPITRIGSFLKEQCVFALLGVGGALTIIWIGLLVLVPLWMLVSAI